MKRLVRLIAGAAGLLTFLAAGAAMAQSSGTAEPWQLGMQNAVGPVAEEGHDFWNLLLWICIVISVFVMALLAYVMVRFRASANPTPSKTSHNTVIEIIWTIVPVIILLVIFVPSMRFLYFQDKVAEADVTLQATGHQWYWSYEYPEQGFEYTSILLEGDDLGEGDKRLLSVDNPVVIPEGATVRLLTTSTDVIHSWAMPAFFVKLDAVPGRLNETWFRATEEGTFYGQCSELCGIRHGFMPIEVHVVSQEEFEDWVADMKEEYATRQAPDRTRLARADVTATQ